MIARSACLVLALMALTSPATGQSIYSQGPVLTNQPSPPSKDLKLIRVGGGLSQGAVEYFDETSIVRGDGTASVWRLYVLSSPRLIGRLMTQAVWVLSDFDCKESMVQGRSSALLGLGLDLVAHGSPKLGDNLFSGQLADALVARSACDAKEPDGEPLGSVSAAVRQARRAKD